MQQAVPQPQDSHSHADIVQITHDELEKFNIAEMVTLDDCGAIATFVGTTRNNFNGKQVTTLEYEAYEPLAIKELWAVCAAVRAKWNVAKIAIFHRLGVVAVGKASVAIAISSVHRREALEAVHFAIDHLKARVPIWKKERYADGSVWKQNAEFDPQQLLREDAEAVTHTSGSNSSSTKLMDSNQHQPHHHDHGRQTGTDPASSCKSCQR